jgi:DnaK suppressor protein
MAAPLPRADSRFADRFAPPRRPTRQMNNLELDTPRQKQKSDPKLANAWKTKPARPDRSRSPGDARSEYMNDKQLEFFRVKLQTLQDDLLQQRRRNHRAPARRHVDRSRPGRSRDDRGRARAGTAHPRPRTQAAEEDFAVAARIDAGDYGFL